MIKCDYCTTSFRVTADGMVQKTFHELLHGPEIVNDGNCIKSA